jgi:hypothetical protein
MLAGQQWPVPKLTPREHRFAIPALVRLMPVIVAMQVAKRDPDSVLTTLAKLDEAAYNAMIDVVYWGLKRAHATLKRDEFEGMEITPLEMLGAVPVIFAQSGLIPPKPKAVDDDEQNVA